MALADTPNGMQDADRLHDDLMKEYYHLADTVAAFDQRLLTIKSWSVTFALATLALGFQQDHYGLFLVAAAGALGFWLVEVSTKSNQVRYYPRMGDIESIAHDLFGVRTADVAASSPLMDWGWSTAAQRVWGVKPKRSAQVLSLRPREIHEKNPHVPERWKVVNDEASVFDRILLWPAVALPHAVAVVLGLALFTLGLFGVFGPI